MKSAVAILEDPVLNFAVVLFSRNFIASPHLSRGFYGHFLEICCLHPLPRKHLAATPETGCLDFRNPNCYHERTEEKTRYSTQAGPTTFSGRLSPRGNPVRPPAETPSPSDRRGEEGRGKGIELMFSLLFEARC